MIQVNTRARLAGSLLLLLATAACGSTEESTKKEIEPVSATVRIERFEAAPRELEPGGSAVLAWVTANATSIAIADDRGNPVSVEGLDVARGQVTVTPSATTAYTLTATGAAVPPAYRTVVLTVTGIDPDPPVIESFEASVAEVPVGGEVTLSWQTVDATSLVLRDDRGVAVDLSGLSVDGGSVVVHPQRVATTYTLTAVGEGGIATAGVSVGVLGLPRVHAFTVEPFEPVEPDAAVTLRWETSRADHVVIRDDDDTVLLDTAEQLSGSLEVTLDRTRTFELTATGPGGESGSTVQARVGASIDRFQATPRFARAGDEVALTWSVRNADAVTITGPGGYRHDVPSAEFAAGSATATVPTSGDYVLAAGRGSVVRTWAIFVEVTDQPILRSFTASATTVTAAPDHPETITLSFVQDGGTFCTLYRNRDPVPGLEQFACPRSGELSVEVSGPADLQLQARNEFGLDEEAIHVQAVPPARIAAFTKVPERRLADGETVELGWHVTDATLVRMERDGAPFPIGPTEFVGTKSEVVHFDTVYTLVAENSLGHVTSLDLTVSAGAPIIEEFAATPPVVKPGETAVLSWAVDGGDRLVLLDPDGVELVDHTAHADIDDGSVTVVAPAVPGSYTYTLRVTNAADQVDETVLALVATDGPLIRRLTPSRPRISLGQSVNLSWTVADDLAGLHPTLALADDHGHTFDVSAEDPNADTVTITPTEEGRHVYTLTASTPGTLPSSAEAEVEVSIPAEILAFTADPELAFTEGGTVIPTVELSWTTANGAELWIFEANREGQPIPPALHHLAGTAVQAEIDAGRFDVFPTATTNYVLRTANRVGEYVERAIQIPVDPPQISSFEVLPADIILGESATLTWSTRNATVAMMLPMQPVVTALPADPNRFVDIGTLPGAEELFFVAEDTALRVDFPPEFRFPFDGRLHTGLRVATAGFLSFDLQSTDASDSNQRLPTADTYRYVHLAPFWEYLTYEGSNGKAYWRFDETARTVTVMWKNWSYDTTSAAFDFNFEVVLHENGNFEYRFGRMWSDGSSTYQNYAAGSSATIGFQNLDGSSYSLISYNTKFDAGLSNLGWTFDLATPTSGSRAVTPEFDRGYTLLVANAEFEASATAAVRVWPAPALTAAAVYPAGPQANVPFEISWQAQNATRVRILDPQGRVLCEKDDPAAVSSGFCTLTLSATGSQSVTVEAINGIERNATTRVLNFTMFPRLAVDAFSATPTFVGTGGEVTVTWQGEGGFVAELLACVPKTGLGTCTPVDIAAQDPNHGSYTTSLSASVEFAFRLADRLGRSEERTANVWVNAPTVDDFTTSSPQIVAGESVTLGWATTGGSAGPAIDDLFLTEVGSRYADISATGTPVTLAGTADDGSFPVTFPAGFTFPYFGANRSALRASVNGWVGFDTSYTDPEETNSTFPSTSAYEKVHLAPFWDDLQTTANGAFHYELRTGSDGIRYLILQWKSFDFASTTYDEADLSFQAVLFENGDIEYRYGEMVTANTSYPQYPNGDSATIGLQKDDLTFGKQLNTYNEPIAGGLRNRSWRFRFSPLGASGQVGLAPGETRDYRLCVTNASLYDACEDLLVTVVRPGDVSISELMIAPAAAAGEWIEVRNVAPYAIDLAGFTLESGAESFAIPATPARVIPPGGFALLARSGVAADNGGLAPTVVYGNAIELTDAADEVRLKFHGVTIDRVAWGSGWPVQANRSITIDPSLLDGTEATNDAVAGWCATTATYGGGFAGDPGALGPGCLTANGHQYYRLDLDSGMPFIDISQTGVPLTGLFATPYNTGPIAIGFPFPYFDATATQMWITKAGYLALQAIVGAAQTSNATIDPPDADTDGAVLPMFDSLYDQGQAAIQYELRRVGALRVMVVQWSDISPGSSSSDYGLITFQAQLWENGDIVFAYRLEKGSDPRYEYYRYIYGGSATIGLENIGATKSFQLFHGTSTYSGGPLYDGCSFRFIRK